MQSDHEKSPYDNLEEEYSSYSLILVFKITAFLLIYSGLLVLLLMFPLFAGLYVPFTIFHLGLQAKLEEDKFGVVFHTGLFFIYLAIIALLFMFLTIKLIWLFSRLHLELLYSMFIFSKGIAFCIILLVHVLLKLPIKVISKLMKNLK